MILDAGVLLGGPGEEVVDDGTRDKLAARVTLSGSQRLPLFFEVEELAHAQQGLACGGFLADDGGFPCASASVTPAADLLGHRVIWTGAGLAAEDGVVDDVGVGLNETA